MSNWKTEVFEDDKNYYLHSVKYEAVTDKDKRLQKANEFLETIASCGRKFFRYEDRVSYLFIDRRGLIYLNDKYSLKDVYTHYKYEWKNFTEGHALQCLIMSLRDYIRFGEPLKHYYLYPEKQNGIDSWGYGEDMKIVQAKAKELGLLEAKEKCFCGILESEHDKDYSKCAESALESLR